MSSLDLTNASLSWTSTNGHTYALYKLSKTWPDARTYAINLGGYLVNINNLAENVEIFNKIKSAITQSEFSQTVSQDGGGAAYIWLGGNDISTEGSWIWTNDGLSIANTRSEWGEGLFGSEPDNAGDQDGLAMGLEIWPAGLGLSNNGGFGDPGEWNDISISSQLYFLVEFEPAIALPILINPLPQAQITEGKKFSFTIPKNTFKASNPKDPIMLSVSLKDGGSLPSWVTFDAKKGKLSGTAIHALDYPFELTVTGTDKYGQQVSDTLFVDVINVSKIKGSKKSDTIISGQGDDWIYPGFGNDVLTGGSDYDYFIFDSKLDNQSNVDIITDFTIDDSIGLSRKIFSNLNVDQMVEQIVFGEEALDANDYLICDRSTGNIYYDPDGSGPITKIQFVSLPGYTFNEGIKFTFGL